MTRKTIATERIKRLITKFLAQVSPQAGQDHGGTLNFAENCVNWRDYSIASEGTEVTALVAVTLFSPSTQGCTKECGAAATPSRSVPQKFHASGTTAGPDGLIGSSTPLD